MIKAVLFDMDGVLIEAKDWHYEALNRALDCFGMPIQRDAHLATFDGLPTRTKLKMLTASRGLPERLHEFLNALKQKYTLEISYAKCKPVFFHQIALSRLKQEGYKLAVCSNSVRNSVESMMQLSDLDQFLDLMTSNEDVSKPKPDPEMYTKTIQHFQLDPTECLILEDNENGIRAARASGAHVLEIGTIYDVTYERIRATINEIEQIA
ncbi:MULTISPECIES: HAD family hydrolase [Maricaulis]|jgi:beta-phosphoglucomutase|uniref:HAD family hydrolase n=1 Tax=Maricaulis TaxID=74317 RepID=UPI000C5E5940|nr:HAD family phosphatase [Maricaulis sp.]MAC88830.1 HAD family hydrolase [Maricaulis sp.]